MNETWQRLRAALAWIERGLKVQVHEVASGEQAASALLPLR